MITLSEHTQNLITNAYNRELEVYSYQINIDNYSQMLLALPSDEIPSRLAIYEKVEVADLPVNLSDEDVQLIADYQYRNRIRTLLRTEKVEQTKAQRVLDALKAQIGPNADQLILEYKASLSSTA